MYGCGCQCRQQLHRDYLQHRDHRTNRGGFMYGCGCQCRQQLHGNYLQYGHDRTNTSGFVYGSIGRRG
jgi:hypothetical protein